jgi:hypothetical protein
MHCSMFKINLVLDCVLILKLLVCQYVLDVLETILCSLPALQVRIVLLLEARLLLT